MHGQYRQNKASTPHIALHFGHQMLPESDETHHPSPSYENAVLFGGFQQIFK